MEGSFRTQVRGERLEVELSGVLRARNVIALRTVIAAYLSERAGRAAPAVLVVDARRLAVLAPDAADELLAAMRSENPLLDQAAYVVAPGTGGLQLRRLVRNAGSDRRRVFERLDDALAWTAPSARRTAGAHAVERPSGRPPPPRRA